MAQFVNLNPGSLRELHIGNERLVSYNVEMTEVTGGTFWKAYTPAQIAGTEPFVLKGGFLGNATASTDLMQYYDPIDLSDKKLRKLAKEILEHAPALASRGIQITDAVPHETENAVRVMIVDCSEEAQPLLEQFLVEELGWNREIEIQCEEPPREWLE